MNRKTTLLFFFILLLMEGTVTAYPRFAALTGDKCVSCHVNPTGGGIRTRYGLHYAKENLHFKPLEKLNKDTLFDPFVSRSVQFGSDLRLIYFNHETGEGSPNQNTFFQMQGDMYLNARLNNYLNLVLTAGLYIPNTFDAISEPGYISVPLPTKYEVYGLVHNLPLGLYFKAGRFIQNFGLKIPEHRAFNRQLNDFYTPYAADAGIELGFSPWLINLTLGLSNGNSRDRSGTMNNSYDFDNQKQFTGSLDFRWISNNEKFSFGIGGSFLNNPFKHDPINDINALRQIGAGFVSIGLSDIGPIKGISIIGEYDYNRLRLRDSSETKQEFNTIFGEIAVMPISGLELKFQFESYDPQLGLNKGGLERKRYSFGFVLYPLTGIELESIYRVNQEADRPELPENGQFKNNEFQQTFKFYF